MAGLITKAARAARLRIGRPFLDRANLYRDRAEWFEAAVSYRRSLEWLPWRHDLHIQLGNCLKELGDYRGAIAAYDGVPTGRYRAEAERQTAEANRRASFSALPYAMADRSDRLAPTSFTRWNGSVHANDLPNRIDLDASQPRRRLGTLDLAVPVQPRRFNSPAIVLDQVGSMALTRDGASEPLLAGVVAVRARIAVLEQIETAEVWLGEGAGALLVQCEPVRAIKCNASIFRLHVLNAWIDSTRLPPGRHWLEVRAGGQILSAGLFVTVADPAGVTVDLDRSDAYVPSPGHDGDLVAAILARPAAARPAARALFDGPIRSVLALRADQLGDVSMSLPALVRLRELFPEAKLSVLVQPAVSAMVEASRLADEVLTVDIRYDAVSERRSLSLEEEMRLVDACAARSFDLAIDLCPGEELRPLLLLTGATLLAGFDHGRFSYLDFSIDMRSRDKVNQAATVSHTATVSALIESLAAAMTSVQPTVPRLAPSQAALAAHGLTPGAYVVIHLGARILLNRWPTDRFLTVAEMLLAETDMDIAIFTDDLSAIDRSRLHGNRRVRILGITDGDAFDAILSNARLMIANDSGPKHLAAVRGVATVSVHAGKLNWKEWGQGGHGTILSKRVPCVGCGLNNVDLCGRDAVCIRSILVEEVVAAARSLLADQATQS